MNAREMSEQELKAWGESLGASFRGGEALELIGDVGAGKTTLTKGIAKGMGIDEDVQSPTFTLSRIYETDNLSLHHYDFYRLSEPGVMSYELAESLADPRAVTVIEWAETVEDVLPKDRIVITLRYTPDGNARIVTAEVPDERKYLQL
jgi:tRNA threonylcarbamoyladenosine biosynthesis protein TsaE